MEKKKQYKKLIATLSIVIPVIVGLLFRVKNDITLPVFLPPIYATLNAFTAILLIVAVRYVKKGNITIHQKIIKLALACSTLFLVMYVLYHMTSETTTYGGTGILKHIYLIILISHIVLSIVVIPFVLTTFVLGLNREDAKHKKLAKTTYPLWLYVAISGVIVYIMIQPYY